MASNSDRQDRIRRLIKACAKTLLNQLRELDSAFQGIQGMNPYQSSKGGRGLSTASDITGCVSEGTTWGGLDEKGQWQSVQAGIGDFAQQLDNCEREGRIPGSRDAVSEDEFKASITATRQQFEPVLESINDISELMNEADEPSSKATFSARPFRIAEGERMVEAFKEAERLSLEFVQAIRAINDPSSLAMAEEQVRLAIASANGCATMLKDGCVHVGLLSDTKTLLENFKESPIGNVATIISLLLGAFGIILAL